MLTTRRTWPLTRRTWPSSRDLAVDKEENVDEEEDHVDDKEVHVDEEDLAVDEEDHVDDEEDHVNDGDLAVDEEDNVSGRTASSSRGPDDHWRKSKHPDPLLPPPETEESLALPEAPEEIAQSHLLQPHQSDHLVNLTYLSFAAFREMHWQKLQQLQTPWMEHLQQLPRPPHQHAHRGFSQHPPPRQTQT